MEYAAFMIAREAVGNALRHARASDVRVHLAGTPRTLRLQISDNGVGIPDELTQGRPGHLGLVGMRECALGVGGRLSLLSAPALARRSCSSGRRKTAETATNARLRRPGVRREPPVPDRRPRPDARRAPRRARRRRARSGRRLTTLARLLGWRCDTASDVTRLVDGMLGIQTSEYPIDVIILDGFDELIEPLNAGLPAEHRPGLLVVGRSSDLTPHARRPGGLPVSELIEPLTGSTLFDAVNHCLAAMAARATRLLHTTSSHTDALIWLPRLRLLVVDDSQLNLDVACKVLELEGAEAVTRTSGEGASKALRGSAARFDAAVLDVQMPGMDGLALARAARGLPGCGSLPLVGLSAGVLKQERNLALRANMSEFLPNRWSRADGWLGCAGVLSEGAARRCRRCNAAAR
ncbi:MAG: response regulator [Rubrivivax sp.]|nr:response regulator [Rubrivivax sp.]